MPNRILHESICASDTLELLTGDEEAFFYRLMVQADDFGRCLASANVLRARCYQANPERVQSAEIERRLQRLAAVGLIDLYFVGAKRYLQIVTWHTYQRRRAKFSKYPAPPEHRASEQVSADDSTCQQTSTDDNTCQHMLAYVAEESRNEESRNEERGIEEGVGGDGQAVVSAPVATPAASITLEATAGERRVLNVLKSIPGWPFDYGKDLAHLRELATDFPALDLEREVKKLRDWLKDKPLKAKANARLRLRNWAERASSWSGEQRQPERRTRMWDQPTR